jgi:hypothetical protein
MEVKKIALLLFAVVLVMSTTAMAFFLQLQPVTTYTDGTPIETTVGVFYDAWVDGTPLATMFPTGATVKIPLIDNTYGATHIYRVRTHLSDGRLSADYIATLTSPLDLRLPSPPVAPLQIVK